MVKELNPPTLYRISLDTNGNQMKFVKNEPFSISDMSGDAAGICALNDSNFLIVNQEKNVLFGNSKKGVVLSKRPLAMTKPEGITADEHDGTLYVAGEHRQIVV